MTIIDPALKIYVEQLRGGKEQDLSEALSPDFLRVSEPELSFEHPVMIEGRAYLAEHDLIVQLEITTKARIPCRVCNEFFDYDIEVEGLVHVEPLTGLKRGFFDMSEILRESILLEVPPIAECHGGHCPARKELEKRLRHPAEDDQGLEEEGYHPFEGLSLGDLDEKKKKKK